MIYSITFPPENSLPKPTNPWHRYATTSHPKNPNFLTHTPPPSQPITTHISQDSTTKKHCVTQPHRTKPAITTVHKPQETKTQPSLISKPPPTNNQATSLPIIQPSPIQTNQTNTETHKETPSENSEPPPLIPTT